MRQGLHVPAIVILALGGLNACGDDVTDPDAFLESAEAEAVMESARALPMLSDLMDRAGPATDRNRAVFLRARELWAAGTITDPRSGSRRRLAVGYALPVLDTSLSEEAWRETRRELDDWVVTVETMLEHLSMPQVEARLAAARRQLARADAAGDGTRRRHRLLLALSELVETTPRYVARSLLTDAEGALEAAAAANGEARDRARERAVRLKDWAERAVAEGDYLLAIQRAYYAIQLVEGS